MAEVFVNKATYRLQSGCLANDTTLLLQGTQGLPTGASFRMRMGAELLRVTAVNPATGQITTVRGTESTNAAAQPTGTALVPVPTAAGMAQVVAELGGGQHDVSLVAGLNSNVPTNGLGVVHIAGPAGPFSIDGLQVLPGPGQAVQFINTTAYPLTLVGAGSVSNFPLDTQSNGAPIVLQPKTGSFTVVGDQTAHTCLVQNVGLHRPVYYNIQDYGAISDSTSDALGTDNTAFIQAAIDAAKKAGASLAAIKGGEVIIPAGYFGFAGNLQIPDNVKIRGVGSRYVGPGGGGQFGSVLAYFGTDVAMSMTTVTTGADIRNVTLADWILTSNQNGASHNLSGTVTVTNGSTAITFSTSQTIVSGRALVFSDDPQTVYYLASPVAGTSGTLTVNYGGTGGAGKTTALPTVGLHIAGNGGGPAVSDVIIERITVAEFDINYKWGDGDSSQADSISWFKCNGAYGITYDWWINSANAGDSTWMHDCHCLGNISNPLVANCIGMYIQNAGNIVLDSCQGDALGTWVKFTGGNILTLTNSETETCDFFLDSHTSSANPIVLDHNTINNGLRFTGNVRVLARGNDLTCIDHRGDAIGINLNGSGVHWIGRGNPNQVGDALRIFGAGTWDEQTSGTFSGLYDQAFHMQGEMLARPAPQYGLAGATDVFAEWELCTRAGIRGAPWAPSTVTSGGFYVIQNPQGSEAFVCVAITGDQMTGAGPADPSFNLGTTTIAAASDGLNLPRATINVVDTSAFPASGTIGIRVFAGAGVWDWGFVTYTSKNATQFLGCTGGTGTGTMFAGRIVGVTTVDNHVTWADAGPSSLHELIAPAGNFNLDTTPGIFCRQGTKAWKRSTVAAGGSLGLVAIRDTVGAVAADFRPMGTVWGDAVGSCAFPLSGSATDSFPLAFGQHNVDVGSGTAYSLSPADASKPFISFTGLPSGTLTATIPIAAGGLVSFFGFFNATARSIVLSAGGGSTVTLVAGGRILVIVGANLVLPVMTTGLGAIPAMVDSTTGSPTDTLNDVGAAFSQTGLNNNFASIARDINRLITRLNDLGL